MESGPEKWYTYQRLKNKHHECLSVNNLDRFSFIIKACIIFYNQYGK
jgi:hypothetical protein